MAPNTLNLLIAHAGNNAWPAALAHTMQRWPITWHQSRGELDTIELLVTGQMHLGVLDENLPGIGGLGVLRRLRRMGHETPCLLICDQPAPRVLREALDLDVVSVVRTASPDELLAGLIVKVANQFYKLDWPGAEPNATNCN